jgi:proline iminopeptidase
MSCDGRLVAIDDTALWVVERGSDDDLPMLVLHGGPGMDHHAFGDYLDPLTERGVRLILVDQRSHGRSSPSDPSTWTLERHAQDVIMLARAMGLDRYVVFGHSYGAFVALQNAVDYPGMALGTIVSAGVPSARWLAGIQHELEVFEPEAMRQRVAESWAREATAETSDDVVQLWYEQLPFHFARPSDPRIEDYVDRTEGMIGAPDVLRMFAASGYGGIEVLDRLRDVPQPVLVLTGRLERTCPAGASEEMARCLPDATLHVFEDAAHMTYVEAEGEFVAVIARFCANL